jgi:hypothetical protein
MNPPDKYLKNANFSEKLPTEPGLYIIRRTFGTIIQPKIVEVKFIQTISYCGFTEIWIDEIGLIGRTQPIEFSRRLVFECE